MPGNLLVTTPLALVRIWAILAAGHAICFFWPGNEPMALVCSDIVAALLMPFLRNNDTTPKRATDRRIWAAAAILVAFAAVAAYLVGPDLRGVEVLWTCMIMSGFMLRGLLTGDRWIALGLVGAIASVLAYISGQLVSHRYGGNPRRRPLLAGTWLRTAR